MLRGQFLGYVIIRLPYKAGVEKEAEYFRDLVVSSQAAAQRYSFFTERAISRICYNWVRQYDNVKVMHNVGGLSQLIVDFCYKMKLCIRNSMKFV